MPPDPVNGVVLAGGLSSRMGRDKAQVELRGRNLLRRTCERLAPQCASLAINGPATRTASSDLAYPTVPDDILGHAGPLAGVLAALDWSAARDPAITHVASAAVDMPFLPEDLVLRLRKRRDASGAPIVCAASGGRIHPVAALWPVALRHALRHAVVVEGARSVIAGLERFGYAIAEWTDQPHDLFLNVNTPADLARGEALAAILEGEPLTKNQ